MFAAILADADQSVVGPGIEQALDEGGFGEGLLYAGRDFTGPVPGSNLALVAVNFITVEMRRIAI